MFKATLHTLPEAAQKIRDGEQPDLADPESRKRFADWLDELQRSRDAIYEARVALAKSRPHE